MKKKRLGLDIDGTITDPGTFIPYLNEQFNKNLTIDDIKEYELSAALGVSKDSFWKWMQVHEPKLYEISKLAAYARNVLSKWTNNHELYYISARSNRHRNVTTEWFHKHKVPYDHIELLGQHNKLEAVKEHQVNIFFEDKHDNACNIAEECKIPVILMDTPYNRKPVPTNVHRIRNWHEAEILTEKLL